MAQIFIAAANFGDFPPQFAKIATLYPAKRILLSKIGPKSLAPDKLLIVDFLDLDPEQLACLKINARAIKALPAIGLVDSRSRQQVLQAREFGFFNLVDREDSFDALLSEIRDLLGNYSRPDLPARIPEKVARSVEATCTSLDMMSAAALSGNPLPVRQLAGNARDITATIAEEGLDNWLNAVQCHHSHTFCHTMMVTGHAVSFSRALGLPEAEQVLLGVGALVHDLGKVKIPLSILDKPGKLTPEERDLVNKHPQFSREILSSRGEVPQQVVEMALWHHEFLDGTGYPDGLSGDQISRRVRMITISDIYSALTEKRAYKDSLSSRQALAVMFDMTGKLDIDLLRKFRSMVQGSEFGRVRRQAV
jgi:HD-GYP domain-containing protein (c-di-GMP phosphodiesterase class II)